MPIPKKQIVVGNLFELAHHCFVIVKLFFGQKLENLTSKEFLIELLVYITYMQNYLNTFKYSIQNFFEKL